MTETAMDKLAPLDDLIRAEIDKNEFPRLSKAWSEFQVLLKPDAPRHHLLLVKKDRVELAVVSEELLVTLLVDRKHSLVTAVDLDHVKGVDLGNFEGSAKQGAEIQLNVWFLDNTRFYWESELESLEDMRELAVYVRGFLGSASGPEALR